MVASNEVQDGIGQADDGNTHTATARPASPELAPLPYHAALVAHLKRAEAEVWAWASSLSVQAQHAQELRAELLRKTYRLTAESHPQAHAICATVLQRLGIEAATTLYQASDGAMGASLWYLPGEAHVVLQGPVLERLDETELSALLGHELAHYKLWALDGGDYHTAQRILDHCMADPQAAASHAESARLYSLYTEIYADRGAAIGAQSPTPAIAILVKVHTGLGSVDPAAYLRQAEELESTDGRRSEGHSHPESYLRAQAVERWWRGAADTDAWLRLRLQGPLSADRLDLLDQLALSTLTRRFIARLLRIEALGGELAQQQARAYFPDWSADEAVAGDDELSAERIDDSVRRYLHSVMLDFALIDEAQREAAVFEAARLAHTLGSRSEFITALKRDAGFGKRELDKLVRRLDQELRA
ncbi:M48 family metalloprotease [Lysobacter sp. CA196]|uniref:M48 family metalloprotease n=1 Tax=Lysobacter sp. CA196 TaxID=3455606 RepID=UPI003F8D566C